MMGKNYLPYLPTVSQPCLQLTYMLFLSLQQKEASDSIQNWHIHLGSESHPLSPNQDILVIIHFFTCAQLYLTPRSFPVADKHALILYKINEINITNKINLPFIPFIHAPILLLPCFSILFEDLPILALSISSAPVLTVSSYQASASPTLQNKVIYDLYTAKPRDQFPGLALLYFIAASDTGNHSSLFSLKFYTTTLTWFPCVTADSWPLLQILPYHPSPLMRAQPLAFCSLLTLAR